MGFKYAIVCSIVKRKIKFKKRALALTLPTPFLCSPSEQLARLPLVPFLCCVSNPLSQAFALPPPRRLRLTKSSVISKLLHTMVNPTCLSAQHVTQLITGFSLMQFLYVVSRMPHSQFSFSLTGPSFPASLKTQSWRIPSSVLGLVSSTSPCTPLVISFIPMTSSSLYAGDSQMQSCNGNLSPKFWAHRANCLLHSFTRRSNLSNLTDPKLNS